MELTHRHGTRRARHPRNRWRALIVSRQRLVPVKNATVQAGVPWNYCG
jgi:hypothetical protein